jgi:ATP-dependent Clp protease ATP-binding subunit ClpX
MFELDGFELEFEKPALEAMADLALERATGARGLRAIMEEVLGPVMYELPGSAVQGRVKITAEVVTDKVAPKVVPFRAQEKSA